jgi:hypothetical protein
MLASLAETIELLENKPTMITNTVAYTIVAIAYLTFAIATWMLFTF